MDFQLTFVNFVKTLTSPFQRRVKIEGNPRSAMSSMASENVSPQQQYAVQGVLCATYGGTEHQDEVSFAVPKKGKGVVPFSAKCKVKWGVLGTSTEQVFGNGPRLPPPQRIKKPLIVAPSRMREKTGARVQPQREVKQPADVNNFHTSMANLCDEDKDKISNLLQHVMQLTTENEHLSKENEGLRSQSATDSKTSADLTDKNRTLEGEVSSLRKKLTHALDLLRAYQTKLQEMQQVIVQSDIPVIQPRRDTPTYFAFGASQDSKAQRAAHKVEQPQNDASSLLRKSIE
eukprot:334260-Rhodomonas_salina.1